MAASSVFTSFALILCITYLALSANLRVLIDSCKLSPIGEIVAIKAVQVLPPKESYKILVSLESL